MPLITEGGQLRPGRDMRKPDIWVIDKMTIKHKVLVTMNTNTVFLRDSELDWCSRSARQGDLPQVALSSWAHNPHQPPSPLGVVAEPGHLWGTRQTITFLIEYLINYSGAESIIHISFKKGGKSQCPLTEASQCSQGPGDGIISGRNCHSRNAALPPWLQTPQHF